MKNNLKILFIQFWVLSIGSLICGVLFDIPKWLGLVISGLMFFSVFFVSLGAGFLYFKLKVLKREMNIKCPVMALQGQECWAYLFQPYYSHLS